MAAIKAKRGGGSGKWIALGGLVLAVWVAVETGWAGYGWAQLRSSVFPRDESLLSWVPEDTMAVVVVDPHQIKLENLGAQGSTVRTALDRTRDDIKKATGIDLAFDVDKLVLSNALAVARGRFNGKKLADLLAGHRYVRAEHEGMTYLTRSGEDAIAVVDDSILLYGDEPGVKAGITAHAKGTSLEKHEQTTARLRQVGWDHAILSTVRITDDRPSVRQILSGSTGPRAVTSSLSTLAGLDLDTRVESSSAGGADELAKLLDEKRKGDAGLAAFVGPEASAVLADMMKKATIAADPATSTVRIQLHLDPAQVDTLAKQIRASQPLAEAYKTVRLFQLLAPM